MAEEVDTLLVEGVDIPVAKRVFISFPDTSSSGSGGVLVSDPDSHHRHTRKAMKALEQSLKKEYLKWYEVADHI